MRYLIISFFVLIICSPVLAQRPFITTWKTDNGTSTCNTCITIPTIGSGYNYDVDWNDDGIYDEIGIQGDAMHDFGIAGTYKVAIRGDFPRIYFNNSGSRLKIININQWGDIEWESMENAFPYCRFMNSDATDAPDLSKVTSLKNCFYSCGDFNGTIGQWDVSTILDMSFMFWGASDFNQDIGDWNVSNVVNMQSMFSSAGSFNQDIGDWNVTSVKDMSGMFSNRDSFDLNIGDWDVSNVENMSYMFFQTGRFNEDISRWDVSSVTDMNNMFLRSFEFNQDIGDWNVSNVIDMSLMFTAAYRFNQDIGNWDVSKVKNMDWTFAGTTDFNQDISDWDVSNVKSMGLMFLGASSFNQNIGKWNVSNVENMWLMLSETEDFNQNLNNWDVSNVKDMRAMFFNAKAFDQSLENWNLDSLKTAGSMLDSCAMSCLNYGATLTAWANNPITPDSILLGAFNLVYGLNAIEARNLLLDKAWIINGDKLGECTVSTTEINNNEVIIYPNPTFDHIYLKNIINNPFVIRDGIGKVILKGIYSEGIDLSTLTNGVYFIEILGNDGVLLTSKKILKY
jgi:surface protein